MSLEQPQFLEVPVAGGDLRVAAWGDPLAAEVIAVHGITASHVAWSAVASRMQGVNVVAPDLRGRGGSARVSGPYGIAGHARDLLAIMDRFRRNTIVAAGHSMGAHIVMHLAALAPERIASLVLVDGGFSAPARPREDPDVLLETLLGPALARLSRTYESVDDYLSFWRRHPAFEQTGCWNEHVEAYLRYDLEGDPPELRSKVSEEAVRADGRDLLVNQSLRSHEDGVGCPVTLVRATRGLLNQPQPLISDESLAEARRRFPQLEDTLAPNTNHYTVIFDEPSAGFVAKRILEAVAGSAR